MKLTIFLFLIGIFAATANTYSQQSRFSFNYQNVTIKDVFDKIKEQSDLQFFYSNDDFDVNQKVNINVTDVRVEDVLERILVKDDVTFKIVDNAVIISRKDVNWLLGNQEKTVKVSGKVTDNTGAPLPGVTVVVPGTTNGTITNFNGIYTLANVPANGAIQFSFVGMKTIEIAVEGKTSIDVMMKEDAVGLDEVVAIGYGTMKKSDLTGSIASVKAEEIADLPVRSITEALQGRVAGVMINKSSGKPGATSEIIIRGVGSINGLNPLFIIDGVSRGNNATYNPKDVASIEIIKDASAAAIYGAQAAGGVVLITTKKGSFNQKTEINVSSNFGVREVSNVYNMLETVPYIEARQAIGDNYALWNNPNSLPNTDWFNELFRTGIEQSHIVSIKGGTQKSNFYVSASYEGEEGVEEGNIWERFSLRANSDYKLSDKILVGTKLYVARITEDPYTQNVPWRTLPYMAVYNDDGTFASVPAEVEFSGGNDVASLAFHHYKQATSVLNADAYLDWEITKGLHFLTTASAGLSANYTDNFTEEDNLRRSPTAASYTKSSWYNESYTVTSTLTYNKTFAEKHDFKAMVGYEIKNSNRSSLSANANSFPVEVAESFALSTNSSKTASGSLTYGRFLSQFARVNYAYDNRYLVTANIRRDGSPKFGPTNRWGVFPSVSVGWKLSEEQFFKDLGLSWVTMVKPRVSWGILGNDAALANFAYVNSYKGVAYHSFDESSSVTAYNSTKVINEDIKWEEIHTNNYGIDFALFANKLTGSVEYYKRNTKDMIYNLPTPASSGIGERNNNTSTMPVNIGSIVNQGWELSVSYRDKVGEFRYNIAGNLSHNKNEVIDLGLPTAYIYSGSGSFPFTGTSPFKTVNGMPIGQIYGFQTDGLIKDQSQIDQLNVIAKQKYETETGKDPSNIYYFKSGTGPGDLLFVDTDGNGRITDDDRTFLGNPWPKYQYGVNLNVGWRNIDLMVDIVGISGRDVFNCAKSNEESFAQDYQSTDKIFGASFSFGNGLTDQPALGHTNPQTGAFVKDPNLNYRSYSDYFVEDGSYLKIKNISLGYTLPKNILESINIDKLRIYVTGQNLFTFTKFTGLDPEFSNNVKNHGLYTHSTYPQTKLFSIGLDLTF